MMGTLAEELPRAQFVLLGGDGDRGVGDDIVGHVEAMGLNLAVENLIGKSSLGELPRVLASLDVLVCGDSAPMHFASAVNLPTVAIFGSTTPALGFGPLAHGSYVVEERSLGCRPCSLHGPARCPLGHFRCMGDITASQVADCVLKILGRA